MCQWSVLSFTIAMESKMARRDVTGWKWRAVSTIRPRQPNAGESVTVTGAPATAYVRLGASHMMSCDSVSSPINTPNCVAATRVIGEAASAGTLSV